MSEIEEMKKEIETMKKIAGENLSEYFKNKLESSWEYELEIEKLKEDRIFHLVLDELHLYRGTQGTEIAYLIFSLIKLIQNP